MQEYDARVVEEIVYTLNQTLVHVNRPDQLTPREFEHRRHPQENDQARQYEGEVEFSPKHPSPADRVARTERR